MQALRSSILNYVRIRVVIDQFPRRTVNILNRLNMQSHPCSSSSGTGNDQIMDQVIRLVKKFDKIDSSKVTSPILLLMFCYLGNFIVYI